MKPCLVTRDRLRAERRSGLCTDHARISDEHAAAGERPTLEVFLDLRHRGHVHRVAREYPVLHRKVIARDRDDLRSIEAAVLGLPTRQRPASGTVRCTCSAAAATRTSMSLPGSPSFRRRAARWRNNPMSVSRPCTLDDIRRPNPWARE